MRQVKSHLIVSTSTDEDMSFKHYQKKLTNEDLDLSTGSKKMQAILEKGIVDKVQNKKRKTLTPMQKMSFKN